MTQHIVERTSRHDLAAMAASARSQVHDIVRGPDRLLVVLHDQHGVAEVAQLLEGREQSRIVALMQADRRFVEDVQHAHEAAADLGREADALCFPAREGHGGALEREIIEADIYEKPQAVGHFLQNRPRNLRVQSGAAVAAQRDLRKEVERLAHGQRHDVADALAGHQYREALGLEASAAARGTRLLDHVLLELLAHRIGRCLAIAFLDVIEHALPA